MASRHRQHYTFYSVNHGLMKMQKGAAESSLGWLDLFLGRSLLLCQLVVPVTYPGLVQALLLHITSSHCSVELSLADCNLFFCFCNLIPGPLHCSVRHRWMVPDMLPCTRGCADVNELHPCLTKRATDQGERSGTFVWPVWSSMLYTSLLRCTSLTKASHRRVPCLMCIQANTVYGCKACIQWGLLS